MREIKEYKNNRGEELVSDYIDIYLIADALYMLNAYFPN